MMSLDLQGVALSTGSACSSGSFEPSHVLRAMGGCQPSYLHGALRCSLGRGTTLADIEYVLEILPGIVRQARALSPRRVCTVADSDTGEKPCNIPTLSRSILE